MTSKKGLLEGVNSFDEFVMSTIKSTADFYGISESEYTQGYPLDDSSIGAKKYKDFTDQIKRWKTDYVCKNIYSNYETHVQIIEKLKLKSVYKKEIGNCHIYFNGVKIIIDDEVPNGEFILSTEEDYLIWKELRENPWVDKVAIEKLIPIVREGRKRLSLSFSAPQININQSGFKAKTYYIRSDGQADINMRAWFDTRLGESFDDENKL